MLGLPFHISEFDVLFGPRNPGRWLRSGEVGSWIVHGNEIEKKPSGAYRFESCLSPVVKD